MDANSYFNYNVMISISLFTLVIVPPFFLSLLCVVGLISTKEINKKIQFSLINVFAGEILRCLCFSFFYLGVPVRLIYEENVSCKLFISLFYVTAGQKFTSDTIYAICVSIFIKYGEKKLKWYVMIPFTVISWTVSIAMGIIPYFDDVGTANIKGFCKIDPDSSLFKGLVLTLTGLALFFLTIQITCIIVTVAYIKKNVLEGNTDVKKVVTKVMVYFVSVSVLTFILSIVPTANPSIVKQLSNSIVNFVAVNYIIRLVYNIPAIATPIVAIAMLTPVRVALKNLSKNYCQCLNRQVHPLPAPEN